MIRLYYLRWNASPHKDYLVVRPRSLAYANKLSETVLERRTLVKILDRFQKSISVQRVY